MMETVTASNTLWITNIYHTMGTSNLMSEEHFAGHSRQKTKSFKEKYYATL
jgi:hypothetical protein